MLRQSRISAFWGKGMWGKMVQCYSIWNKTQCYRSFKRNKTHPIGKKFPAVWFAQRIRFFLSSALIILHFTGLCRVIIMVLFATVLANIEDGLRKASYPAHTSPSTDWANSGLSLIGNSLGEAGTKWNQEQGEIEIRLCGMPAISVSAHLWIF